MNPLYEMNAAWSMWTSIVGHFAPLAFVFTYGSGPCGGPTKKGIQSVVFNKYYSFVFYTIIVCKGFFQKLLDTPFIFTKLLTQSHPCEKGEVLKRP